MRPSGAFKEEQTKQKGSRTSLCGCRDDRANFAADRHCYPLHCRPKVAENGKPRLTGTASVRRFLADRRARMQATNMSARMTLLMPTLRNAAMLAAALIAFVPAAATAQSALQKSQKDEIFSV